MSKIGYDPYHTIPRDEKAAKVLFYKGIHYDPDIKSKSELHQDIPHRIRNLRTLPNKIKRDPSFKDLTGLKRGNLTVIGMYYSDRFNKWVVRCACGCYEVYTTTVLNKPIERLDQTRCQHCMDLERLKHKEFFKKHGIYPWQQRMDEICF